MPKYECEKWRVYRGYVHAEDKKEALRKFENEDGEIEWISPPRPDWHVNVRRLPVDTESC